MMNETYHELASRAIDILKSSQNYRIIIVLIGSPGSGKSTILKEVCDIINSNLHDLPFIPNDNKESDKQHVQLEIKDFLDGIPDHRITEDLEDDNFKPYKRQISKDLTEIHGRGGEDTKIMIRNSTPGDRGQFATYVPMDGFHLSRDQLSHFKDPEFAIFRRGSPFTFDNVNLINMTKILRMTMDYKLTRQDIGFLNDDTLPTLEIPSFSHHLKDPVLNGISIPSSSRILIMEGLYYLLQDENWRAISDSLLHGPMPDHDVFINNTKGETVKVPILTNSGIEFWKIHIDEELNLKRVAKRHLQSGIVDDLAKGEERFKLNDSINGEMLMQNSSPCDLNIYSIEDKVHT